MDEAAMSACACGAGVRVDRRPGRRPCPCGRPFRDSQVAGSTATVALVGGGRLLVANCGDSRAVLSRAVRAVPLSDDHKPDRPDELVRIEAAGGRVIYLDGARVQGILAMSRPLGDGYLKPMVISEPEVVEMEWSDDDELLIVASDGLWTVISNELACSVARTCLDVGGGCGGGCVERSAATAAEPDPRCSAPRCSAATLLLAKLVLGRKSSDNVIVVDLRRRESAR